MVFCIKIGDLSGFQNVPGIENRFKTTEVAKKQTFIDLKKHSVYIYRPVKWATSLKKQWKISFFLNNMSTIRATNPNVWQLLKHFKCSSQWNSCRGSQGHLKVTQGHFKVIWGHFWWFSIFCLHIHGYTNLIVWLARNTAETI